LRSLHYRRTACGDRFQLSYESAKAYLMPVANDINARQSTALHDVVAVAELALSRRAGSAHPAGTICENAADAYPVVGELLEKLHEPRRECSRGATAADAREILDSSLADPPARPVVRRSVKVQVHGNGLPCNHLQACDFAA